MGLGYNGDDVIIKIGMDMREVQSDLKQLQNAVTKAFEKMETEASENAKQMENKFDTAFERMESDAKSSTSDIMGHLGKIKGYVSGGFSTAFRKLGGVIGAAFTVDKVKNFTVSIVEAAADLEAMEAAFEQVFVTASGDFTEEATKNIKDMCKEWDMEVNTLKGDYSAFAAQFKGLGMEMGDAMDYSNTSMKLAADAAAMFNIPMDEAIEHVRSFVKGNYIGGESIQLFGSQAMLASYAVEQGIIKEEAAFKELTEAQKQMIRLDFAQHQYDLAGTTGQAAREADMYANQLTKLKQKWQDFKAKLGEKAMERMVGLFKDLSTALEQIDIDAVGGFFGDLLGMLGEGFGAGLKVFTDWINSVNWEWFAIQLEEIAGLLKDFGGGALDGIKSVLDPVAEGFLNVWDGIMGVDDINTENMDSTNLALVRIKPVLEWFADHGEEVGKGIAAVTLAVAGWKTLNFLLDVTCGIGDGLSDIHKNGFWAWLCTKSKFFKNIGKLGTWIADGIKAVAKGFTVMAGTGAGTALLTITFTIGILALWEWQNENDPEIGEKAKDRANAKAKGQLTADKELNDGKNYDWSKNPIVKFFKDGEWVSEESSPRIKARINDIMNGDNYDWKSFGERFKTWFSGLFGISEEESPRNIEEIQTVMNGESYDWASFHDRFKTWFAGIFGTTETSTDKIEDRVGKAIDGDTYDWTPFKKKWDDFWSGVADSASTWKEDIQDNIDELGKEWEKFWNGVKNSKFANGLKTFFNKVIDVLNGGIKGFLNGMNYIIKGINFVYRKITGNNLMGEIQVAKWTIPHVKVNKHAKGTDNAPGGLSLVGEAGREIVSDPRLGTFMADKPMLLNLTKGSVVLRNSKTEQLMDMLGIRAFAGGKNEGIFDTLLDGFGTLWNYMTNPKKLLDKMLDLSGLNFGENPIVSGLKSGIKKLFSGSLIVEKIQKWFDDAIPDVSGMGANANAWRPHILKAAAFFGEKLTEREIKGIIAQIDRESGGSQSIVQSAAVVDVNTLNGNPARGLLQYIPQTFNRYKVKGFDNIYNGYHQLLAFFNNSNWRKNLPYGKSGWGPTGSRRKAANGILVDGATPLTVGEKGHEAVVPLSNARALKPFGQAVTNAMNEEGMGGNSGGVYEFTIPVIVDGKQIAVATAKYTKEELEKLEQRQNRRNGIR